MRLADGHHAVLGFGVVDRVTAQHGNPGFASLFGAAADDLLDQACLQKLARERKQVQREQRLRAHRVQVGQGVGGANSPEVVRVIHDRREEVQRHDQGAVAGDLVDSGIVPRGRIGEDARVGYRKKVAQNLRELGLAELTRSTGPVRQGAQPDPGSLVCSVAHKVPFGWPQGGEVKIKGGLRRGKGTFEKVANLRPACEILSFGAPCHSLD